MIEEKNTGSWRRLDGYQMRRPGTRMGGGQGRPDPRDRPDISSLYRRHVREVQSDDASWSENEAIWWTRSVTNNCKMGRNIRGLPQVL